MEAVPDAADGAGPRSIPAAAPAAGAAVAGTGGGSRPGPAPAERPLAAMSRHPLPTRLVLGHPATAGGGGARSPSDEAGLACVALEEGRRLRYQGSGIGHFYRQAALAKADRPVPPDAPLFYFEMEVERGGEDSSVGMGLCSGAVPLGRLPGWDASSYGYHGDDGFSFTANGRGTPYGPQYSTGALVGLMWDRLHRTISFCLRRGNGPFGNSSGQPAWQGVAFRNVPNDEPLFPCVGLRTRGSVVVANFGPGTPGGRPFAVDIGPRLEALRMEYVAAVRAQSLLPLLPPATSTVSATITGVQQKQADRPPHPQAFPASGSGSNSVAAVAMPASAHHSSGSYSPRHPAIVYPTDPWVTSALAASHPITTPGARGALPWHTTTAAANTPFAAAGSASAAAAAATNSFATPFNSAADLSHAAHHSAHPPAAGHAEPPETLPGASSATAGAAGGGSGSGIHLQEAAPDPMVALVLDFLVSEGHTCTAIALAAGAAAHQPGGSGQQQGQTDSSSSGGGMGGLLLPADVAGMQLRRQAMDLVQQGEPQASLELVEAYCQPPGPGLWRASPAAALLHWRLRLQAFLQLVGSGAPHTALAYARRYLVVGAVSESASEMRAWVRRALDSASEPPPPPPSGCSSAPDTPEAMVAAVSDPQRQWLERLRLWPSGPKEAVAAGRNGSSGGSGCEDMEVDAGSGYGCGASSALAAAATQPPSSGGSVSGGDLSAGAGGSPARSSSSPALPPSSAAAAEAEAATAALLQLDVGGSHEAVTPPGEVGPASPTWERQAKRPRAGGPFASGATAPITEAADTKAVTAAPGSASALPCSFVPPQPLLLLLPEELQLRCDMRLLPPKAELQDGLTLLAYADPWVSPLAHLLDPAGRARLAQQLNVLLLQRQRWQRSFGVSAYGGSCGGISSSGHTDTATADATPDPHPSRSWAATASVGDGQAIMARGGPSDGGYAMLPSEPSCFGRAYQQLRCCWDTLLQEDAPAARLLQPGAGDDSNSASGARPDGLLKGLTLMLACAGQKQAQL